MITFGSAEARAVVEKDRRLRERTLDAPSRIEEIQKRLEALSSDRAILEDEICSVDRRIDQLELEAEELEELLASTGQEVTA